MDWLKEHPIDDSDISKIRRAVDESFGPGQMLVQSKRLGSNNSLTVRVIDLEQPGGETRAKQLVGVLRDAGFEAHVMLPSHSIWRDVEISQRRA